MRVIQKALTFDDVLLVPAHSLVMPREVDLSTQLTRDLRINLPILSAAMDTVTEGRLAIAMAQEGGIGIVHKNFSAQEQARQVRKVKRYESGVVKDPFTVRPDMLVRDVIAITQRHRISGLPVVEANGQVVGIVTNRDLRFETRLDAPVSSIMTPKAKLVTVREGASIEEARELMHAHRLERVLVVDEAFQLRGLITVKDIIKTTEHPFAAKDSQGRLLAGAAVGTGGDTEERVSLLVEAGVDVIVVDTSHGHSQGVLNRVRWIKTHYPDVQVIGGNIATAGGALALIEAGADGVKVGIGPGSICTTRIVAGVGVPQISAVANVAEALKPAPVFHWWQTAAFDFSGDIAKAIAAGAFTVMLGGLFAGTEEAPGEVELFQGRSYKSYRGMGSLGRDGSKVRATVTFKDTVATADKFVPEGIEGRVPYKGPLAAVDSPVDGRSALVHGLCRLSDHRRYA